ncbi:MAG: tRNA threonylcarbamoyladenosine dehydratase [Thermoanaerobacteraceae bacterium]
MYLESAFLRTELLIGIDKMKILKNSTVAVFGIGGVGSYAAEAIARSGVGNIILIDSDNISISNINRQIHADVNTIGMAKVDVMKKRLENINPHIKVLTYKEYFNSENACTLLSQNYDYVIDAIDTVSSKIELIIKCQEMGLPIISSMGAGNKLDPTKFEVTDIYKTSICPLAKIMRYELKKRGVKSLKVVYSKETPVKIDNSKFEDNKHVIGSISFVPPVAGLILAGEVIKDIAGINKNINSNVI